MIGLGSLIDFGPVPIPAPHINSVTPSSGFATASTSVTIDGTGFVTGATVTVDGVPATSVVVVSPTEITCTFPAEGGGGVPVVSAVSFGVVDTDGGGQRVVVTVDDSTGCTAIAAGGVSFSSFAIDDATHVSGVPGAHAVGVVDVVVTNGVGDSTTGTGLIKYWTPSQVTGSPLWFDAERGVTEGAGAVSAWAEQSAGTVNASQSTTANKPTWTASVFGTLHSIEFSKGGPSFMNVAGQTVSTGDAITWRAGIKTMDSTATATDVPGVNPANTIMGGSGGGGACNAGVGGDGTAGTVNSRTYDGANWQLASGGASVNDGNPHVIGVNVDGTSKVVQCVQDGANVGSAGTLGAGFTDVAGWDTIGAGFADDDSYEGHIAWFFYLPSAISGPDDADLTAWSAQRWGTPSAAPFVPESTALSSYWSARVNDYAGSPTPWPGVASAGVSGTTGALGGGPFPDVGTPLNGHVPPNYVAASNPNLDNPTDITGVVATTGGTIFGLFNAASTLAPAGGGGFDDPAFLTDGNFDVGVVLNSSGVKAYGYSAGYRETVEIAASDSNWHMFVATWDGTTLTCYVDSATPATVACPALTIMTGALVTGHGHAGTYLDAQMPELGTSFEVWDGTDVANFRDYCNRVYGLSL